MKNPKIIFYGTPEFAVPSLKMLYESGFTIAAVVTASDKPAGRGLKMVPSPVKMFAESVGIPVLQPVNMKDPSFIAQLTSFQPDLQIVIAFRMMPRVVWSLPPLGTFNLHASLLPDYRGAAPINRAIMNGETMTGLTTFFLNDQIDCGRIILAKSIEIGQDESAGELHDRMKVAGAGVVLETVKRICSGNVKDIVQDDLITDNEMLKTAPKIFKEDCVIDWTRDVTLIFNQIRGLSPYPGAYTDLALPGGQTLQIKILKAQVESSLNDFIPGSYTTDNKTFLKIASNNGLIRAETVQVPGRKVMNIADFLRGNSRMFSEQAGI